MTIDWLFWIALNLQVVCAILENRERAAVQERHYQDSVKILEMINELVRRKKEREASMESQSEKTTETQTTESQDK